MTRTVRRRPLRRTLRTYGTVLLFLSPWLVGLSLFVVYPMVSSLYFSFTHYDLLSTPTWVGLGNYRYLFTSDDLFWRTVRNTLWVVAIMVPIQVVFALGTAWVLTRPKRGVAVYRTVFFLPAMVPAVAAALGFVVLLDPAGPINTLLKTIGIRGPLWFYSASWSKPSLLLLSMWGIGNTMIIFLAALLDVPKHLYEAADLEGAGSWAKLRHVTLPTISPVIFFSLVTGIIYGFQYFTEAYVASVATSGDTTGTGLGEPDGSLLFYGTWLYRQAFGYLHMGYASAMAWVLFLVILGCTTLLIATSRRWVHYGGALR